MKIIDAYNEYRTEYLIPKGRSASLLKQSAHHCDVLVGYLGNIEIEELDIEKVTAYLRWLMQSRSSNTVSSYAISLRQVLRNCQLHDRHVMSPDRVPLPKPIRARAEFVTAEDVRVLLLRTDPLRDKLIISLLYSSGVRVSELCSIKISDIYGDYFTVTGKGGKIRLGFIDERTKGLLKAYLSTRTDACGYLIVDNWAKHRLSTTSVERIIRRARSQAGISRHITPHSFRHGFATDMLENGAAIQDVSEMLGHSSVQTTMTYRHVSNQGLWQKYKKSHTI